MSRRWSIAGGAAIVVLILAAQFVAEPMRVSSGSMWPTYGTGDEVLIHTLHPGGLSPRRGQVIALRVPGHSQLMVKRVAAVGGDTLAVEDGVLIVNGQEITESYVDPDRVDATYFGPVRVPTGQFFVLGDNRSDSFDSRDFGAVDRDALVGTVLLALWRGSDSDGRVD